MVCTKCGKSIKKGQKCCDFCGTEVISAESKYSRNRIIFLSVVSAFAVLFILVAVIFMCMDYIPNQGSYTVVIEKCLNAIQEINVDEYMEVLPEDYIKYTLNTNENYENYDDMLFDYEEKLWQENRSKKNEYGMDFKIVYQVESDILYQNEDDLSKLTQEYNNKYDSKAKIEEAAKAKVIMEVKSSEASENYESLEICFIKIDNNWYLDIEKVTDSLS